MRSLCALMAFLLLAAALPARSAEPIPDASGRVPVFVSIVPQIGLVEEIGGDRFAVHVLVEPGQSPHAFEPTPRQIVALSESRVWFTIGLPFEPAVLRRVRALRPDLEIVDTSEGVPRRVMATSHAEEGEADTGGERRLGLEDPHVWLSPKLAAVQAANIAAGLSKVDPERAAFYSAGLERAAARLDSLDAAVSRLLEPFEGRSFYVFHPAFGYFAEAYGLRQIAVQIEGKEPSARDLAALVDRARSEDVRVMFVQPQFSAKTAEAIAREIGCTVVPIDPLARDYHASLIRMAEAISAALGEAREAAP